jgi:hypothetical protein
MDGRADQQNNESKEQGMFLISKQENGMEEWTAVMNRMNEE